MKADVSLEVLVLPHEEFVLQELSCRKQELLKAAECRTGARRVLSTSQLLGASPRLGGMCTYCISSHPRRRRQTRWVSLTKTEQLWVVSPELEPRLQYLLSDHWTCAGRVGGRALPHDVAHMFS